jgi:prepilin-type N-terminal cleavage/methylation domain-containing protein
MNKQLRHIDTHRGFTIVELLVVIAVLGILFAITVFSYGQWNQTTITNQVKSDLNGVIGAMEDARNFGGATGYPSTIPASFSASPNVTVTMGPGPTSTYYCINAVSTKLPSVQYYVNTTTTKKIPQPGTC